MGQKKADFFLVKREKKKKKKITSYKKANFMRAKLILNMYVVFFVVFFKSRVAHTSQPAAYSGLCFTAGLVLMKISS